MGCRENEGRLAPYMLGALNDREMAAMEAHIDSCAECLVTHRQEADLLVHLVYAAPQLEAPDSVKQRLMARIPATPVAPTPAGALVRWLRNLSDTGQRMVSGPAGAAASVMAVVLILAGVWVNLKINDISEEKDVLESQLETMADGEAEMAKMVNDLRDLTYWANAPDASVKLLSATDRATQAGGMIVVRASESAVKLWASNMPVLPTDRVFRVWMVKGGTEYNAGTIDVDSNGNGMKTILLPEPISNYESILITVDKAAGKPQPSGDPVLRGNLGDL